MCVESHIIIHDCKLIKIIIINYFSFYFLFNSTYISYIIAKNILEIINLREKLRLFILCTMIEIIVGCAPRKIPNFTNIINTFIFLTFFPCQNYNDSLTPVVKKCMQLLLAYTLTR
jgi:hypothetical protein